MENESVEKVSGIDSRRRLFEKEGLRESGETRGRVNESMEVMKQEDGRF